MGLHRGLTFRAFWSHLADNGKPKSHERERSNSNERPTSAASVDEAFEKAAESKRREREQTSRDLGCLGNIAKRAPFRAAMESLKKLEEILIMDPRHQYFGYLDSKVRNGVRTRTMEDFYKAAAHINLHEGVPEAVRNHFQTARNLLIYSWFCYPFNVTASFCALVSVEMALRIKTGDRKSVFAKLLQQAIAEGWVCDKGFSIPTKKLARIREYNRTVPPEFQTPEPPLVRSYCNALAKGLPALRNLLAHGSSYLAEDGARKVQICAEFINQLFPIPPSTA